MLKSNGEAGMDPTMLVCFPPKSHFFDEQANHHETNLHKDLHRTRSFLVLVRKPSNLGAEFR
eukprot:5093145-Amphidinium_carterae.1